MSDDILKNVLTQALQKSTTLQELANVVEKEVSCHVRDGSMTALEAVSRLKSLSEDVTLQNLLYQEEEGQVPKLNPLLVAEVMERLQFDGDAPELRAGHMMEGGTPAVPVLTDAVDPVYIGLLLKKASREVAWEFEQKAAQLALSMPECDKALTEEAATGQAGDSIDIVPPYSPSTIPRVYENPKVDPDGYTRGQLPALRVVEQTGLLEVSALEKQQLTWQALVTTQGRRSSVRPIEAYLLNELQARGFCIELGEREAEPLAQGLWVTSLSGPMSLQICFSPVTVARAVILHKLLQRHKESPLQGELLLHVRSVDAISHRLVGWSAQIYEKK
jgi:hypothetical protein